MVINIFINIFFNINIFINIFFSFFAYIKRLFDIHIYSISLQRFTHVFNAH